MERAGGECSKPNVNNYGQCAKDRLGNQSSDLMRNEVSSSLTFTRRGVDGVTMFIVTCLSLFLLVYVGFGEGRRTYEQMQIEKLAAQGQTVQSSRENYLRDGLPLKQYAGFATLADPIVQGIDDIDAMAVYDHSGQQVFLVIDKSNPKLPEPPASIRHIGQDVEIDRGETYYQVVLPLRTRFDIAGSLVVVAPTDRVAQRLDASFRPLLAAVVILSFLFAVIVWAAAPYLVRARAPWLQIGYAITFLAMSGLVVATLISLYSEGVQSKSRVAAFTLSQRISDIVEFNIKFRDVEGLDKTFSEYRRLNSETSEAALIIDDVIQIASDNNKIGNKWITDSKTYEYSVDLSRPDQPRRVTLSVAVPKAVVYHQVERSVRNFAALFVATAFLAGLFLQVADSMQRLRWTSAEMVRVSAAKVSEEAALIVVKPIFFLAVFLENLMYSFLPKYVQDIAVSSGKSLVYVSAPFTAYYLFFALSLIPSGHFSERYGPKPLILTGLILASASVFGLALPLGIVEMTGLRAISGVGQGMLFIGIQAYILAVASPEKKTQGAGIIVFGFQGGMISGMAIGSLLVTYLDPQGVFVLSAAIGFATAVYSLVLIPRIGQRQHSGARYVAIHGILGNLGKLFRDSEFLKTMFCIGVPAKAILTGTITFALPLLLGQYEYRQEEIGQIIMLYGIGVVASSFYVSRLVDRTGNTRTVLFWGAVLSGLGLIFMGVMDPRVLNSGSFGTVVVVTGVLMVGFAHGFINAPVVTHIAHTELASEIGANSATTAYRFLERIGHVAGPLLVGQLFLMWGQSPHVLAAMGVATVILGLFFIVGHSPPRVRGIEPEIARS